MGNRPMLSAVPKDILNQLKINESDIILELSKVDYLGGYFEVAPKTGIFSTNANFGNLLVTKKKIFFIKTGYFNKNKIKVKIEIPVDKIIREGINQNVGSRMNLQETAAATAGIGSWGLIAGLRKQTIIKLPFKISSGVKHEPAFAVVNHKDATKLGQVIMGLFK